MLVGLSASLMASGPYGVGLDGWRRRRPAALCSTCSSHRASLCRGLRCTFPFCVVAPGTGTAPSPAPWAGGRGPLLEMCQDHPSCAASPASALGQVQEER